MNKITTKLELCELITRVLKAEPTITKESLLKGSDIESVFHHVMKSIVFRAHRSVFNPTANEELILIVEEYACQFKELNYEKLMQWTMDNIRDLPKSLKVKYKLSNVLSDVEALDIYCVINNQKEFTSFVSDLENRINHKFK